MTDRDHFAAAALTGLLAQGDDGSFSEESYARGAYRWADAMLRERERTSVGVAGMDPATDRKSAATPGACASPCSQPFDSAPITLDAAPAATVNAESVAPQPTAGDRAGNPPSHSGTGDTDHGASPEARARTDADRGRTDKADSRPGEGTGDTPVTKPMPKEKQAEVSDSEAVAWAIERGDGGSLLGFCHTKREAFRFAHAIVEGTPSEHFTLLPVPLYLAPALTDAEREAVEYYVGTGGPDVVDATLRGLLERLGGEK